jgi:hypothetical protein
MAVCRKLGVSAQTFYRWKRKFAGMAVASCGGFASWRQSTASVNNWWQT